MFDWFLKFESFVLVFFSRKRLSLHLVLQF